MTCENLFEQCGAGPLHANDEDRPACTRSATGALPEKIGREQRLSFDHLGCCGGVAIAAIQAPHRVGACIGVERIGVSSEIAERLSEGEEQLNAVGDRKMGHGELSLQLT